MDSKSIGNKMRFRARILASICGTVNLAAAITVFAPAALAQEAASYGDAFQVPVFEQIDLNGIDLVSGSFRITSPTIVTGTEEARSVLGLQWTGKAWTHIEQPSIWRSDSKYTVNYMGTSQEFKGRSDNFAEKKPIMGNKLDCRIHSPGNLASECIYTHRNGDVVHFKGIYSPYTPYPASYGPSSYAWGNLGMSEAYLISVDNRNRRWGSVFPGSPSNDANYYKQVKQLGYLTITTPNHNNDTNEHYLRPKSTTQTITDRAGSVWRYTINSNRLMTKVDVPGNGADTDITYNNGKVQTVTNPNGTWTYSYTTPGDYGTTTVTDPYGHTVYVKYHREKGYITEHRDKLNRLTYYAYDSGDRLISITYPEQNSISFTYDARGNVISKTQYPKPSGGPTLIETASYPSSCTNAVICNQPNYIVDARGHQTDFQYAAPSSMSVCFWFGGCSSSFNIHIGTTKPTVVTLPAAEAGQPRPQVRNTYTNGVLVQSSTCRTQASCAGGSDEVVTTYDYGGTEADARLRYGVAVVSEGTTLRTCYDYDALGRKVSESPPRADIATCQKAVAPDAGLVAPSAAPPASTPTFSQ